VLVQSGGDWAALLDPNGAAFGIIPVVSPDAIPPVEPGTSRIGRIAWADLTIPDADRTRDFYVDVVGWSVLDIEMEDAGEKYHDYGMAGSDGQPAAGVCHARGANLGLPPVWLIYLPVGDSDESLRRVQEEGGAVIRAVTESDAVFRYAVVRDPVGACFAMIPG